ncbi:hypothetical protein M0802_012936 [Mischocyttarus mexicanus]|nr:hypothetical protein M0802_012936 [Mischocyttarus mexicanus]
MYPVYSILHLSPFLPCRLLTFCYLAALNCWLLLCPVTLSHDWQMGSVPLVTSLADTRNLATCLFFGGCLVLTYKAFTDFEVSSRKKKENEYGICSFNA